MNIYFDYVNIDAETSGLRGAMQFLSSYSKGTSPCDKSLEQFTEMVIIITSRRGQVPGTRPFNSENKVKFGGQVQRP